ncbi:GATA-binding factor 6-B [Coprinopsis cinerea AmutBmut pab1-1]|nr:GATA-binding factor 6-B [Coprinopsis cinerea AmutBmut pab1-1]
MPQFGWESSEAGREEREAVHDKEQPQRSPPPPVERKAPSPSNGRAEHQNTGSQFAQQSSDQSELVIDPALRSNTPRQTTEADKNAAGRGHSPPPNVSMPLRAVEPSSFMSSSHRRPHFDDSHRLPSPPTSITASGVPHSHSPSPSVASADRSSASTPSVRRSPPQSSMPPPPHLFQSSYHHDPSIIQSSRHHEHFARADHPNHTPYIYAPPPPAPFDHRYDHSHPVNHSPYSTTGIPAHFPIPPPMAHHPPPSYGHPYPQPGPQPQVQIVHTDDAATKLSDRVRRRCFNCCTTDTSTWRRSNLSPGKVLCNKCGLFERTHSRPRPEQFPHKRGPLATASLQRRTPPANNANPHFAPPPPNTHLPPIAPPYQYTHPSIPPLSNSNSSSGNNTNNNNSQQQERRDVHPHQHQHHPHHAPPPPPSGGGGLPGLQSWHGQHPSNGPSEGGSPHLGHNPNTAPSNNGNGHSTSNGQGNGGGGGGSGSAPHSRRPSDGGNPGGPGEGGSNGGNGGGGGSSSRLPTPRPDEAW